MTPRLQPSVLHKSHPGTMSGRVTMTNRAQCRNWGGTFEVEEGDIVLAPRMAILAELVSASDPAITCCSHRVKPAPNALRLDASRPIRRRETSLCKELHFNAMLYSENMLEGNKTRADVSSTAMAMSWSREEAMFSILSRCTARTYTDTAEQKTNLFDTAKTYRTRVAIDKPSPSANSQSDSQHYLSVQATTSSNTHNGFGKDGEIIGSV